MKLSDVELPSNRKFGFFFSAVFGVMGAYFFIEESATTSYVFFALGLLFAVTTLVKADALLPLNKLWMRFGLLLGMIVSPIVLGFIFFGLFTPISILMRLFGRDELRLKFKDKSSHWIIRESDEAQTNALKHQF
jgi:hypothetical protein